jgi:hypothetical protein
MKRFGTIIAVTLFAIFAIADLVHDFITNDPIHYFSEQPHQLLVVAAIAIIGGLVALIFYRLSPHWQRRVELLTLGLAASFLAAFTGYMLYMSASFLSFIGISQYPAYFIYTPVCLGVADALLWYFFYRVYRKGAT